MLPGVDNCAQPWPPRPNLILEGEGYWRRRSACLSAIVRGQDCPRPSDVPFDLGLDCFDTLELLLRPQTGDQLDAQRTVVDILVEVEDEGLDAGPLATKGWTAADVGRGSVARFSQVGPGCIDAESRQRTVCRDRDV